MDGRAEPKVKSLAKALNILSCFTIQEPILGVTELANRIGVTKSNIHNILSTFTSMGYLQRLPDGRYTLGLKILEYAFIINQNRYSIFDRTIEENGLKETAHDLKKGIIAFSPLAQGMLTNRYLNGIPADSRIAKDGRFLHESSLTPERLSQIKALNELAGQRGQTLAEMALSWILKDDHVTSVLIGASKPEQILDNIGIIGHTSFSKEELDKIDAIVK